MKIVAGGIALFAAAFFGFANDSWAAFWFALPFMLAAAGLGYSVADCFLPHKDNPRLKGKP